MSMAKYKLLTDLPVHGVKRGVVSWQVMRMSYTRAAAHTLAQAWGDRMRVIDAIEL
jgi:hypothetical protein